MGAVTVHSDLEPKKIKSATASTFSPSICYEVMGLDAMMLDVLFFFLPPNQVDLFSWFLLSFFYFLLIYLFIFLIEG